MKPEGIASEMMPDVSESGYTCLVQLISGVYLISFVVRMCQRLFSKSQLRK